jgi:hypothetical protein
MFQQFFPTTFGSAINPTSQSPFSGFSLNKGIYQIHLDGTPLVNSEGITPTIRGLLNNLIVSPFFVWNTTPFPGAPTASIIIGGDRLINVGDNTTLSFAADSSIQTGNCELVITKLQ